MEAVSIDDVGSQHTHADAHDDNERQHKGGPGREPTTVVIDERYITRQRAQQFAVGQLNEHRWNVATRTAHTHHTSVLVVVHNAHAGTRIKRLLNFLIKLTVASFNQHNKGPVARARRIQCVRCTPIVGCWRVDKNSLDACRRARRERERGEGERRVEMTGCLEQVSAC